MVSFKIYYKKNSTLTDVYLSIKPPGPHQSWI